MVRLSGRGDLGEVERLIVEQRPNRPQFVAVENQRRAGGSGRIGPAD